MTVFAEERYQEKKQHGSVLFPFNIYPCTIPMDFPSVPLHWHNSMEVIYVKKGVGRVQMGVEKYEANEGDIFIIPPGILHAIRQNGKSVMEYENIIFDVDFLGSGAADICAQEYLVPLLAGKLIRAIFLRKEMQGYEKIASCLMETEELCADRAYGYELGVKAAITRMFFWLIRLYPERPWLDSPDTEKLKMVLHEVEKDYTLPRSVDEMAEKCGWSSSHFMRWFKQMTGSSFVNYYNERRLAFAAKELRRSNEKVLVIAGNAGFDNLSHFNRQFKKRYGVTPREYRNI